MHAMMADPPEFMALANSSHLGAAMARSRSKMLKVVIQPHAST